MVESGRIISRNIEDDEINIDLIELFGVLWRKAFIIILVGFVFAVLSYAGTKFLITPLYTSTTKMYVLSKQNDNATVTYTDLQTGTQLTKDYMELVKSRPVLEKVIEQLNLDMSSDDLKDTITVETPEDTRILTVKVKHADPEMARDIANAIREAVSIQIKTIMDAESVNVVEEGNLPEKPSSPSAMKNTLIGGFLGCVLAVGIILLIYLLDDTIKTPDDVEKYLGLSVLASVPIQPGTQKSKKRLGRHSVKKVPWDRK